MAARKPRAKADAEAPVEAPEVQPEAPVEATEPSPVKPAKREPHSVEKRGAFTITRN